MDEVTIWWLCVLYEGGGEVIQMGSLLYIESRHAITHGE